MKKTLQSLGMAILFPIFVLIACSKGDKPTPNPKPVDPPVYEPAPRGTVVSMSQTIDYNQKATFTYSFINATKGVYIGGKKMVGQSGTYTTDSTLKVTTSFTIMAQSKDSTTVLEPIIVTVNPDPNVSFITMGSWKMVAYRFKSASSSTTWIDVPSTSFECNLHTFFINGTETMTFGSCTSTPGNTVTGILWHFVYNISMPPGFYWHGVTYDKYTKVSDTRIMLQRTGPVQIGSTVYPEGIIEESYAK